MKFRNDIQGLRAIAVLLVFIFHLSASLIPGGFIGVDIFFVISGFLVTGIVSSKINADKFSIIDFYKSRIQRIMPAYVFMLLIVSAVVIFLFINTDSYSFRKSLFWALLFNSNNHFATLDSYFGVGSNENPLLHTWTLAVEMQFYLLLPILLMVVRNKRLLLVILSTIILGFISYATYGVYYGAAQLMYFSLSARIPEFLIGSIVAILKLENTSFVKKNANLISFLGLVTLLGSAILFAENTPFPGVISLIPCIGTLALLLSPESKLNAFLSKKIIAFIGEISYSLYLWHWPIMAFMRYHKNSYEFTVTESLIVILASAGLSLLSYYLVERTLRKAKGTSFLLPFGAISSLSAAMVILSPKFNSYFNILPLQFVSPSFGLGSHGDTFKTIEIYGDTNADNKNILLIGDSHALTMKKFLDDIGKKNGFSFKTITNDTYPTLPGLTKNLFENAKYFEQYNMLISYVEKEISVADLIILQFEGDGHKWEKAFQSLLLKMKDNQRLLVFADYPGLDKNPVRLNKDIVRRVHVKQDYSLVRHKASPDIMRLIEADPKAEYIDLTRTKVFDEAPFYKDSLMYYDHGHLNEYGARMYAREVEGLVVEAVKSGSNNID